MFPRELVRDWAGSTSMHAAAKSVLTDHPVRRHIWIVLLLTAWAVCLWQLTLLCTRYSSYPKRVTVDVIHDGVPFPSITLCNMRTLDTLTLQRMIHVFDNKDDDEEQGNDTSKSYASDEFIEYQKMMFAKLGSYMDSAAQNGDDEQAVKELISSKTISANIPEEFIRKAANQLDRFVALCKLEKKNCNIDRDFTEIFSSTFYTCFTYKSPEIERQQRDGFPAIQEGRELGWSTVVLSGSGMLDDFDPDNFIPLLGIYDKESTASGGDGVRIIIHPPDTLPLPETEGYDVPRGYSASFDIRPKLTQRVDQPYGQCTTVNPFDSSLKDERYRKNECLAMCLQKLIVEKCDCIDSSLPHRKNTDTSTSTSKITGTEGNFSETSNVTATHRFCREFSFHDSADDADSMKFINARIKCAERAAQDLYDNTTLLESCACYSPCSEFTYDVSYSLSKWPSTKFEGPLTFLDISESMKFQQRFLDSCHNKDEYDIISDYLENKMPTALRDFVRINVFSSDSSVIRTIESPDYLPYQLISDIGGQLGVWIGVSVLTLSEFFEMLLFILWELLTRRKNNDGPKSRSGGDKEDQIL